jgi:hypothetical protein
VIVVVAVITTVVVIMFMFMFMLVAHVVHVLFVLYARMLDLAMLVVHAVMRNVNLLVPVVRHEVDRSAAGVVFTTMLRPVLLVSRGDVEIERLRRRDAHDHTCGDRNHCAGHDQLGRGHAATEGDLAKQARSGHIYRDTYVTRVSKRRGAEGSKTGERARQIRDFPFHKTSKHEPVSYGCLGYRPRLNGL